MRKKFIERRRYPRIKKRLSINISTKEYDFYTQTYNISCNGAYCSIDKDLPLLTKLSIVLLIPKNNKLTKVYCKGVVVRKEKTPYGKFNIAIFFNDIEPKEQKKLFAYIKQYLPKIDGRNKETPLS